MIGPRPTVVALGGDQHTSVVHRARRARPGRRLDLARYPVARGTELLVGERSVPEVGAFSLS